LKKLRISCWENNEKVIIDNIINGSWLVEIFLKKEYF